MNFIISGLHQVQVYAPGTTPGDVLAAALAGGTISVPGVTPPVVDVSDGRVYRGIVNPTAQDRVEVVHFPAAGTYLVICGILPHLQEDMFGWVKVIR